MGHRHYPYEDPYQDPENNCNAIWDAEQLITPHLPGCYSTDLYTARAKKWIVDHQKNSPNKPFFLMLAHTAPHARLALPAMPYPQGGGLKGGVQWLGESGRMINTASHESWDSYMHPRYAKAPWPEAAKRHASMITRLDESMGDLVTLLKDLKIDRNTYIIFTSDNGAHDEYGAVPHGGEAHPSLRQNPAFFRGYGLCDGIKRDVWEGGLRVPCLVYAPTRTAECLILRVFAMGKRLGISITRRARPLISPQGRLLSSKATSKFSRQLATIPASISPRARVRTFASTTLVWRTQDLSFSKRACTPSRSLSRRRATRRGAWRLNGSRLTPLA